MPERSQADPSPSGEDRLFKMGVVNGLPTIVEVFDDSGESFDQIKALCIREYNKKILSLSKMTVDEFDLAVDTINAYQVQ